MPALIQTPSPPLAARCSSARASARCISARSPGSRSSSTTSRSSAWRKRYSPSWPATIRWPAAVGARGHELLREQRVALAAAVEALDELPVGPRLQDVLELDRELGPVERRELDPAGARVALHLRQQRAQR